MAKIAVAGLGYIGLVVLSFLGYVFTSGATVYAVSRVHLGHPATIAESYRLILPDFGNLLGISILVGLTIGLVLAVGAAAFGVPMYLTFVGGIGGRGPNPAASALAVVGFFVFLAALVVAVYLYAKWSLSIPVCVLEKLGVMGSIQRSWNLTTGTVWRILLITLLAVIMSTVLTWVLSIPYFVGLVLVVSRKNPAMIYPFLMWQYFAQFLARTLSSPIAAIASVLIYYDQRVRKEAFDIQLMMQAIGVPRPAPAQTFGASAPGPG
jgi:hypothetical protein